LYQFSCAAKPNKPLLYDSNNNNIYVNVSVNLHGTRCKTSQCSVYISLKQT